MEKKKNFIVNIIFYVLIAVIIWGICKYIFPVMTPFIVAAIIQIPVRKSCKKSLKMKKVISVLLVGIFYIMLFAVVIFVGVKLIGSIGNLIESAPELYNNYIVPFIAAVSNQIETMVSSVDVTVASKIEEMFQELSQNIGNMISDFSVKAVTAISGGVVKIPGLFVKIVIAIVSTFFIAGDYDYIMDFIKRYIPKGRLSDCKEIKGYVKNAITTYVKSYLIIVIIRNFVEPKLIGKQIGLHPLATLIAMFAGLKLFGLLGMIGIPVVLIVIANFKKNKSFETRQ